MKAFLHLAAVQRGKIDRLRIAGASANAASDAEIWVDIGLHGEFSPILARNHCDGIERTIFRAERAANASRQVYSRFPGGGASPFDHPPRNRQHRDSGEQ